MLVGIPRTGFKKEILVASRAQKHKIKSFQIRKDFLVMVVVTASSHGEITAAWSLSMTMKLFGHSWELYHCKGSIRFIHGICHDN